MLNDIFIFVASLAMVIRGATLATKYSAKLAESFRLSRYIVGFIVVAVISVLPETFISINSAINGVPSFGLGMLFGSNIADLTLVFAVIILVSGRALKVESNILKNHIVYPFMLVLPLVLGFNGHFSRIEGTALIIVGVIFYYFSLKNGIDISIPEINANNRLKNSLFLLLSMVMLLAGSYFIVTSATGLANAWAVSPILIGMLIVGLGTTLPELFFSLNSVKKDDDSLAIGDILGTVLADATIVVGIIALISPFTFPQKIIYVTGAFMVTASLMLFYFMSSGRTLSKKEAHLLLLFWVIFVITEFLLNR